MWSWCSCLGHRGSGSTRYPGELAARAAGDIVPGEPPSLTEKPGRPESAGSQRVGCDRSDPVHINTRLFPPMAALPP